MGHFFFLFLFFSKCSHLLWKHWKSLLGFCLSESCPFHPSRKSLCLASWLSYPKNVRDNAVNQTENADARSETSQTALTCNLERLCSFLLLTGPAGEMTATSQSRKGGGRHGWVWSAPSGARWKTSSLRTGNWWSSCSMKCPSSQGSSAKLLWLLWDSLSRKHEQNTCVFGKLRGDRQELLASKGAWQHP